MPVKEQTFAESALANWNDFLKFLYNSEKGEVLGRTANSWTKILIFYVFYYGFLAALFAISITIVRGTLDEYTPTYQTRLQTPGVGVQPKISSEVEQTSEIKYTYYKDQREKQEKDPGYQRLVYQIDQFLYQYGAENQTSEKGFQNCTIDQPMQLNQDFSPGQKALGCYFNKTLLGPCGVRPYGYDIGKPCIYVKLNRIINWFPVGYTDLSAASGFTESNAPNLATHLQNYDQEYKPYLMYTSCYGYTPEQEKNLNPNGPTDSKYYPAHMGLPFSYYPYHGKARQPGYANPVVAVQLNNVKNNTKIDLACKVYAMNIVDSKDMGEGFFRFDIQMDIGN